MLKVPCLCSRFWVATALAVGLLTACADLPANVERPVSTAIAGAPSTSLAAVVQQRREAARTRQASGFMLLANPPAAYGSRLALAEGAQKTLDLQYYAIHADGSTVRLMTAVREAAVRGVRVRILLDDFHSTGRNAQVMALALEPNIQMRMFNPLRGPRASAMGRVLTSITDAQRIQQRMHNKLFLADNVLGVTGGRNLGDAYFGKGEKDNFVDLDVLAAGPIVQDMSRSFDQYWNDERAFPVQSLVKREELERLRDDAKRDSQKEGAQADASPALPDGEPRSSTAPSAAQRARAWDQKPMDLTKADFTWAPALLVADKPGKISADRPGPDAQRGQPGVDAQRAQALGTAGAALAGGDTVVEGLLQLIGRTQRELLVISPYFVPGPDMKKAFADARARGVRIRILTNSLASNDAPVAHVGYARHREELLTMGIELYELRSEAATLRSALSGSGSNAGSTGQSRSMLHSKVLVMDSQWLVIGSMNLDLRSQLQNTELALLIRSDPLAHSAGTAIEATLREDAWHVERDGQGLVWRAPTGSGVPDTRNDPDASTGLRLLLRLIGPLAPDSML
jgi:phosphatidylserine/phosphatidylglycerophosphate/cardiolipin synthase-like enzyme